MLKKLGPKHGNEILEITELRVQANKLRRLIQVHKEAHPTNVFRVALTAGSKEKLEHQVRLCKQLANALQSYLVVRIDQDIHALRTKSIMVDRRLEDQDVYIKGTLNKLERLFKHEVRQGNQIKGRLDEVMVTLQQAEDIEPDDDNDANHSSNIYFRRHRSGPPKIKTFYHLCLRGGEILALLISFKELGTCFHRLENWSFGLVGIKDEPSDEVTLDKLFWPGVESVRPFWTSHT